MLALRPPIRSSPDPTSRGVSAREPRRRHPCRRSPAPQSKAPDDGGRMAFLFPRDGASTISIGWCPRRLKELYLTKWESRGDDRIYRSVLTVVALCSPLP